MRITLAYNLRTEHTPEQAELLTEEQVARLIRLLSGLDHEVTPVEVSLPADDLVDALLRSEPDLVFNVAEGRDGPAREARFPAIYERLGLPYTGGDPSLLYVDLDKRLAAKILDERGVRVPRGTLVTPDHRDVPTDASYPVIVKPNYGGSSQGITQDSVAESAEEAREVVDRLLEDFPEGLVVEEMISGRELVVPMLEAWPGRLLEIVEAAFETDKKHDIIDYEMKRENSGTQQVEKVCPPELTPHERQAVLALAERCFSVMKCPDLGRVDIRLDGDGNPYFLEINPLPNLNRDASFMTGARAKGLEEDRVIELIVRSAARRYGIQLATKPAFVTAPSESCPTLRDRGIRVGRFETGPYNAITDVEGVQVGHITHVENDVPVPGSDDRTEVRTGITAVVADGESLFDNHLVAGGFILNGIGEMSGLIQAMEWGWLETPILLTDTMSVGLVHTGVVQYMIERHPELGRKVDVIIPVVGETNDGFLNDNRVLVNTPETAVEAIRNARGGPVEQGSVGGGTGMITFDFAGGIGTSSRRLSEKDGGFTLGVLVQSNFGRMRNLTVDGAVVGRDLDVQYPYEGRRRRSYGSIIVVVATDAPLLSPQLDRISKRAALGLGRVGSHAQSTSGEIVFAFSTGNRAPRASKEMNRMLNLSFVTDEHIDVLYEAAVECTEEAVLNAISCSSGQTGRDGRSAPEFPVDTVVELLAQGRKADHESDLD